MSAMRLLIIDDEESALEAFRNSVDRYMDEKQREIEVVEFKTFDEALKGLDNSFDGAIIDLKLADREDGGTQVILEIRKLFYRLPIFVLTAFPNNLDENIDRKKVNIIGIYTKGTAEAEYTKLLDRFSSIYDTGLTRIMGGRGTIEANLREVFSRNLLPHVQTWESYGKEDPSRTKKALLRHTLNHLSQLLDDEEGSYFPEEMYLAPPLTEEIRTGSIVKDKKSDKWFVVMTPACDLVRRESGERNTDRILVVEIEPGTSLFPWFEDTELSNNRLGTLGKTFRNNHSPYYHCLPTIDSFQGGFLNFRKLSALDESVFLERFEIPPRFQIAPSFLKDIVGRFSSYYARQGQPDIDYSEILSAKSGNND